MSVYAHTFLPSFLTYHLVRHKAAVSYTAEVPAYGWTRLVSLPRAFLRLRLVGAFLGPLTWAFRCHVHFAIVYTPGLVGCLVCTVSFVCSWFTCIRATYTGVCLCWDASDHASYAVVATCESQAGDRRCLFQLCVICRRNTLLFYLVHSLGYPGSVRWQNFLTSQLCLGN